MPVNDEDNIKERTLLLMNSFIIFIFVIFNHGFGGVHNEFLRLLMLFAIVF